MLWKRKWLAVLLWLAITAGSVEGVRLLPSVYKAEAVVLVDSQKIPEDLVSSTVTGDIADRLALISQSIMTSARLLALINKFGLYPQQRNRLTQEELLAEMRQDISVKVEKSWTGGRMQAFRLAYQGSDPKVVAEVTNQLAGLYVAENVRSRQTQAKATVDFLHQQLDEAKASLDKQETQLAHFKFEHNGALPEQENAILGNLNGLRIELQGVQDNINQAQQTRESLKASLSAAEASEASLLASVRRPVQPASAENIVSPDSPPKKSQILEEQLKALLLKYTPEHPDVQRLTQEMKEAKQEEMQQAERERLRELRAASASKRSGSQSADAFPPASRPELLNLRERIANLHSQIDSAARQIDSLQREREDLLSKISDCERRVGQLPITEQQMTALKRNYEESESHYNSLLQKELSASMATDMEHSRDSERFTVIDPARVPQKPVKPKRLQLAAAGSLVGLAAGLLLAFALEFRKQTFLGEWELPPNLTVLGRVPLIRTAVPPSGTMPASALPIMVSAGLLLHFLAKTLC